MIPTTPPTADEIRAQRQALGLTQTEAAALIGWTMRGWQSVEAHGAARRAMQPVIWAAWLHLAGVRALPFAACLRAPVGAGTETAAEARC